MARKRPDPVLTDAERARFYAKVGPVIAGGCRLWQAGKFSDGYGQFKAGGQPWGAHRVALLLSEGPPPPHRDHAAHSCRNKSCVAPEHLRWATVSENFADKVADGTSARGEGNPSAKLTRARADALRREYARGDATAKAVGRRFGVSESQALRIIRRQSWRD